MADAFSAGFREFCGGVQHAVSGHRILLFFLNSRLICVSSAKVRPLAHPASSSSLQPWS
jgi:hypothetical protein